MRRRNYLQAFAIALALLGLIALYALEFRYFNRMLHASGLVGWSLLAGALIGALLGYRFRHRGEDRVERVQIYLFFIVLTALFMPLFASLSNRLLAMQEPRQVPVEFVKEEGRYANRFGIPEQDTVQADQYFIFFYKDGGIYRIKSESPLYPGKERGDTITIPLQRGLWGYELVSW